jgi:CDP-paratose synthetase
MKIFVTGATGFIGKHLVNKLIGKGINVTVNLYGNEIPPFDSIVSTYRINENNPNDDISFLKQESFDGVIHLASLFLAQHKSKNVIELIDSNIRFSSYILECSAQAKIKWFINTGTFWQHYQNNVYSPVNLYAATKQAFESIAQFYIDTNQIQFCTIKLSDTFGPYDTRPKIFNLWKKIAKSGEILEMSPGEQKLDISYVDDIISAYFILLQHLHSQNSVIENGDVFAVKALNRYTLKNLAKIFEDVTGHKLNIKWGSREYNTREVMNPWDIGKVVPGWTPKSILTDSIKKVFYYESLKK